jgi:hypothetical protein
MSEAGADLYRVTRTSRSRSSWTLRRPQFPVPGGRRNLAFINHQRRRAGTGMQAFGGSRSMDERRGKTRIQVC